LHAVWRKADSATNAATHKRSPEGTAEVALRTPVMKEPCMCLGSAASAVTGGSQSLQGTANDKNSVYKTEKHRLRIHDLPF